MATITKNELAAPSSRADFLQLMKEHANKRVSWGDDAGVMPSGLYLHYFWNWYFNGRERVTIGELIPYVQYRAPLCENVPQLVAEVLIKRGVIRPGYDVISSVPLATRRLPNRYRP